MTTPSDQPESVVPQRQRALHTQPFACRRARLVHARMNRVATCGVQVVVEGLLEMDQRALARAVGPVLEGREGDRFRIGHEMAMPRAANEPLVD